MERMCAHISSHIKDLENTAAPWPFAFLIYLSPNLHLGESVFISSPIPTFTLSNLSFNNSHHRVTLCLNLDRPGFAFFFFLILI